MKYFIFALLTLPSLAFAAKDISFKTHLRYLDQENVVTCREGVKPNGLNYPTNSSLDVKTIALSVPDQWSIESYWALAKDLQQTCEELMEEFNREKNEHGTIPVEVKITYRTHKDSSSYVIVNESGDNEHAIYDVGTAYSRTIEFKVGKITFIGAQSFHW